MNKLDDSEFSLGLRSMAEAINS